MFVLYAVCNDISIPLYWINIDNHGGNSNSLQRIDLIKWFITNCPNITIDYLLADREFPSHEFIPWLNQNNINFIFRSKSSVVVTDNKKRVKITKLCHNIHNYRNKTKAESKIRRGYNSRLLLTIRKNQLGEIIYIISNRFQHNSADIYRKRWTIEAMFAKFKTKGFNLGSTRIMKPERIISLFMFMAITYCYACKLGKIDNRLKPTKLKKLKHNEHTYVTKEHIIFNRGVDLLKILVNNYLSYSAIILNSSLGYLVYRQTPVLPGVWL